MEGMRNQAYKSTSFILPDDMLENILSQLPAKSLVRFEVVSKAWNSMISSPTFSATHLKRSKKSRNMFRSAYHSELTKINIKKNEFIKLSGIKYPTRVKSDYFLLMSHGLMLSQYGNPKDRTFGLWSPSTRTCLKFKCPDALGFIGLEYGLCYDLSPQNYKVLVTDWDYYAIFHYTTNYWSDVKMVNSQLREVVNKIQRCQIVGLPFEGNLYWIFKELRRTEDGSLEVEGLIFNSKEEEFKRFACKTRWDDAAGVVYVIPSNSCFCMVVRACGNRKTHIILSTKLDNHGLPYFIEIDMKVQSGRLLLHPMLMPNENEIIVLDLGGYTSYRLLLYNIRDRAYTEFLSGIPHDDLSSLKLYNINRAVRKVLWGTMNGCHRELPYVDNLFLNRSINDKVLPYE